MLRLLACFGYRNIYHLSLTEGAYMRIHNDGPQSWVIHSDCAGWRTVQAMQGHAVTPDRRASLNHHQRPWGNVWKRWQAFTGRNWLSYPDAVGYKLSSFVMG